MTADTLSTLIARAHTWTQRFGNREAALAKLIAQGTTLPTHVCVAAANYTTLGGAAAEAITIAGLLATDIVTVTLKAVGATPRTITKAVCTSGTLTITFSGDPSTDHVVAYHVMRPVG